MSQVLLSEEGLRVEGLHRSQLSRCERGVWGWCDMSWSICWAFMTQGF